MPEIQFSRQGEGEKCLRQPRTRKKELKAVINRFQMSRVVDNFGYFYYQVFNCIQKFSHNGKAKRIYLL